MALSQFFFNAVVSSLPTFYVITFTLPAAVIKRIDRFRKRCLWRRDDLHAKRPLKAAWEMMCMLKDEGGLEVTNLKSHNKALMMKNPHKS